MKTFKTRILVFFLILLFLGAMNADSATRINIGTGGTGGVYYPMGGGVAEVLNKHVEGVTARAEVSGASTENCRLVSTNEQQIALANADAVYYAYNGGREFKQPLKILSMFSMYPSNMQIVCLKNSPIQSIQDLKGKRVAVGPPGGNNFVMTWTILKAYGFTEKDIKPVYQTYVESVGAMKDGAIDAVFVLAGYPTSAILDLSTTRDIRMIPMESNMIKKVTDEFKFYSDGAVPPGVYRGVTQTIPGLAVQNVWIAYKDLPETLIYKIVKAIFDQKDYLVTVHKKAAEMNLQDAVKVPCPMHPGAIKYFKEKGALK
jgi:TRAP transporter TAXI family solute receptor